jgi:uncharacterized membrane protein
MLFRTGGQLRSKPMPQDRTRKIVVAGILAAISIFLGLTRWGFIPWVSGASLTIMHVPVIIGAVLEGPVVGLFIGLIFGVFSIIQATTGGVVDVIFSNPLIAILPRLLIGPLAWLAWTNLKRWPQLGLIVAGIVGSLTNAILVLGMIGVLGLVPWPAIGGIFLANSLAEAVLSALITLLVVAAWKQIDVGRRKGSNLE